MKNLGYYNGRFDEIENMSIPMLDRVCFFGDGVYDATYSKNYKIYDIDKHIDRFFNSINLLEIKFSYTKLELKNLLYKLIQYLDTGDNFVYFQVTRGSGIRNHTFPEAENTANLWINIYPKDVQDVYTEIKVITMEDTRFLHCNIKTLNLIPSVIASERAKEAGCFEAVFHRNGRVTECAHSNISIIKDGTFITAPTDNLILPGITRANLLENCKLLGIPYKEEAFYLQDLMNADEIIVSSVGALCQRVIEIDGKKVGKKNTALLRLLQDAMIKDFNIQTSIDN